eukprot:Seg663.8 transcript_id=Seg663.8/GoldUCD/mRNA.D3Y31 product="hypothetical protein" protein_id=Seg663.8/GoldUCD/D3Y31
MNASKTRQVRKKGKEREMTVREELQEVKTQIAAMQEQLEDTFESKEKLRRLNFHLLDDLKLEKESKIPFTQSFKLFKSRRHSEQHQELTELAIRNKVSKADPSAISNGILSWLPRLMHHGNSSHEARLQSPQVSELEFIKHVSGQDSGLEIRDEKVANKADVKEENSRLVAENQAVKNKFEALKMKMANDKQSYEECIKELEERQRESIDEIEAENGSQIEKRDLLIFDLRDDIICLKNSKEELTTEVRKLELEKQSMETSNNLGKSAVEKTYNYEKKKHQEEVEQLKEVIKEGEELNTKQEIQMKTLQEELQHMSDESKALKESTEMAMGKLKKLIIEAEDKFSKAYNDFVEEKKSKLTTCVSLTSEKEEMEKQIAIFEKKTSNLNEELIRFNENLKEEKQNDIKANGRNDSFHAKLHEQDEEIRKLREKLRRRKGIRIFLPFLR